MRRSLLKDTPTAIAGLKQTASERLKLASEPVIRDLVFDRVMIGPLSPSESG